MACLISETTLDSTIFPTLEKWENANPDFAPGYWVTDEGLHILRQMLPRVDILAHRPAIPVFWGNIAPPQPAWVDALSAICIARYDGTLIQGVSALNPFDDYRFARDLGRCFAYGLPSGGRHWWRVVGHFGDVQWLKGYWFEDEAFLGWVKTLQIPPSAGAVG
jgi:hypothetical protein